MKVFVRRRVYVNLIIAAIVSLLLTFPMILELMGFDKLFPLVHGVSRRDRGDIEIQGPKGWLEIRRIIEFSFILATTGLIGKVFELVGQREEIRVENEKLRADNLQSQYNLLVNQVNPHFFFNSMNSLSSLVREGRKDDGKEFRVILPLKTEDRNEDTNS